MESPTTSDPLNEEKKEMPIFESQIKPQPTQYSKSQDDGNYKLNIILQSLFLIIKVIMFIAGLVNISDCPQQPMVQIYLVIAGIGGVAIKLIFAANLRFEIKALDVIVSVLRSVEFVWMIVGAYFIFSIYQPNYSPYFGPKYCERHSYLTAFALLILHCAYFVCVFIMTLTKFSNSW